jgi:hypothetical protein
MSVTPRAPRTPRTPPSAVPAVTSLALEQDVFERLRGVVPRVAAEAVETIMREVPSYARPFSDAMGARIRTAVELALVKFPRAGPGRQRHRPCRTHRPKHGCSL